MDRALRQRPATLRVPVALVGSEHVRRIVGILAFALDLQPLELALLGVQGADLVHAPTLGREREVVAIASWPELLLLEQIGALGIRDRNELAQREGRAGRED